jgi:hypothetical protein
MLTDANGLIERTFMDEQKWKQTTAGDLPHGKAAYTAPVLKVFGSIGFLTLGKAGATCDGIAAGSNNPLSPGSSGPVCASDPRAKHNVVRVGDHPQGFGLYLFDYKPEYRAAWGHGRQFGVMADEVERVVPQAISRDAEGLMRVDYAMLGISRTVH